MEIFKVNETGYLYTATKFGAVKHKYSEFNKSVASEVTFKEAYNAFVDQFYTKNVAVLGQNGMAYIMVKKDIYVGKYAVVLEGAGNYAVKISDWRKVNGLKSEFKQIVKKVLPTFKPEARPAGDAVVNTEK